MPSSLMYVAGFENQLLVDGEKMEDLAVGADVILEYRGTLRDGNPQDEELVLAFGILCCILIGGLRKHRQYRLKAYALREDLLHGIAADQAKQKTFFASYRPTIKDLESRNRLFLMISINCLIVRLLGCQGE